MTRWLLSFGLLLPLALLAAERTPAPLPPDQAVKAMVLPEGFRASLVAAEPDVVQPISYCFDARGRLFVAEALNYGAWQPTGKDRIVMLEEKEGGVTRKVFYEGFNYITGIEVGFGGVWVMSPPSLYFVPCREGDDKPSGPPEVLFDGFGHKESRHNLANGFTWGPDGWLYAGHGRTSPSDVGVPGTPADQRIHCDGGVYRIHPTRRVFENFADGTTNPWGVDFDDLGQCFVSNCVNPHLFHMLQGGHYEPWRGRPSSLYAYERLPSIADHLHYPSGKPGEMRGETSETLAMGGGHAHCGTLIYLADQFPASFRNTVFLCNVHGRRINHDLLRRKGSGYVASHGKDFMVAGDPWFMGVTLRTGPDGSVYVSDWSDTGECHTYKPHTGTGRIYKISHGAPGKAAVDLTKLSDDDLVNLQLHKNDWHVRHARRLLQERSSKEGWNGKPVHAALEKILAGGADAPQRLRALWALHVTGGLDAKRLTALLDDTNEHVRAWSIQLLCEGARSVSEGERHGGIAPPSLTPRASKPPAPPAADVLAKFADMAKSDPSPVVRLYLSCALQRLPLAARWPIAEGLLGHAADADDANLPLMHWYAVEPLAPADPARALRLATAARIPLVREYLARRVVDDAGAKKDKGDLTPLVAALTGAPETVQLDLLKGAREALRGRKGLKMPDGWSELYARLSKSDNAALREHAVVVALVLGDPQALLDLRKVAVNASAATAERVAALEALIEKRPADLAPVLHELLADKAVRRAAIRGLGAFAHEATPRRLLAVYADLSNDEKQDAVAALASRKDYALPLLDAVDKKTVARGDMSAFIARQLYALNDKQVSERLKQVWGEVRDTAPEKQKQLAKYKALLTPEYMKNANLNNGRLLFSKSCQQCHKLFGEGQTIGPDLTGYNRSQVEYLLVKIIDPSSQVAKDYHMSIVATQDGRVLTGILVERTPTRYVVQTATERIVLAKDDVEEIKDSPLSIMPEGQLDALTNQQVRDLLGYLGSKSQVPLPGK